MSEIKTKVSQQDPHQFIESIEHPMRRQDGLVLLDLYSRITGQPAKMWGPTMIGYGQYHYQSERSSQSGDWPLAAFSPRKASLTLYIVPGFEGLEVLLDQLGKHRTSVGCLYINKLADVDMSILAKIVQHTWRQAKSELTTS